MNKDTHKVARTIYVTYIRRVMGSYKAARTTFSGLFDEENY